MKFLQGLVAMVAMVGLAASAGAASLATLTIDSFGFAMNHTNAAEGGSDDNSANVINMDIVMGGYQGGFGSSTDADKTAGIVGFEFGYFGPVAAYTTGPDAAPRGDITGGVLTVDLSAWTAYWNGTAFNQGGSTSGTMVTTYTGTAVTGTYTAIWTKLIDGGPFGGKTGHWSLSGTATAVPEPMSMALVGSSLLGLIGLRRRLMA